MLILPKSCFMHFPKTGGVWTTGAIKGSGIPYEEYTIDGNPHIGLEDCPCPEKFKISFVRHPVQLYRSYWQYKMGAGWGYKNEIDIRCRSENFHAFVGNVLENFSGVCGTYFEKFVGPTGEEIEFIGKYENLVEDLILGLKAAGEEFDEEFVRRFPPQNVSDRIRFPAEYTPELEEAVRKSEWRAIRRFGYD